jgi:lipid A 3-O-deacylase PagL
MSKSLLHHIKRAFGLAIMVLLCVFSPLAARAQDTIPGRPSAENEVMIETLPVSVNMRAFGDTKTGSISTIGVEFVTHSRKIRYLPWYMFFSLAGPISRSRVDATFGVFPLMLLHEAAEADQYGNPLSSAKKFVPGFGVTPLGIRFLWRESKPVRVYLNGKFGGELFTQPALAPDSTHFNVVAEANSGTQIKIAHNIDLRVGFEYIHICNFFLGKVNPGLDALGVNYGVSFHLPSRDKTPHVN